MGGPSTEVQLLQSPHWDESGEPPEISAGVPEGGGGSGGSRGYVDRDKGRGGNGGSNKGYGATGPVTLEEGGGVNTGDLLVRSAE